MRRTLSILMLPLALSACETTNSDAWVGGAATPFGQAENSCTDLLDTISDNDARREFFVGCMKALGWAPKSGASINL